MFVPPQSVADVPSVNQLVSAMDKTVAGLEIVKKRLAWQLHRFMVSAVLDRPWRPVNAMVYGPSGIGKTFVIKALLEACNVVWCEVNATEYSDVGFVGRNLAGMYSGLVTPSWRGETRQKDFLPIAARYGVVIIDEIDKMRVTPGESGDRQGGKAKALQAELLKLVEGTDVLVQRSDDDRGFIFNTRGVLHIGCGAFQGLNNTIAYREDRHVSELAPDIHEKAGIEDFIHYGFLEEFVGRFATLIPLPLLTASAVSRILKDQIIPQYQAELRDMGLDLEVDEGGISQIASHCLTTPLGTRSLRPLIDATIWKAGSEATAGHTIYIGHEEVQKQHATLKRKVSEVAA